MRDCDWAPEKRDSNGNLRKPNDKSLAKRAHMQGAHKVRFGDPPAGKSRAPTPQNNPTTPQDGVIEEGLWKGEQSDEERRRAKLEKVLPMFKAFKDDPNKVTSLMFFWDQMPDMRSWYGQTRMFQILKQTSGCSDQTANMIIDMVYSPDTVDQPGGMMFTPRPYPGAPQGGMMPGMMPGSMPGTPNMGQNWPGMNQNWAGMPPNMMPWWMPQQQQQPAPQQAPAPERPQKKGYTEEDLVARAERIAEEKLNAYKQELEARQREADRQAREDMRDQQMEQMMYELQQMRANPPMMQQPAQQEQTGMMQQYQSTLEEMQRQLVAMQSQHEREKIEMQAASEQERAKMEKEQAEREAIRKEQEFKSQIASLIQTNQQQVTGLNQDVQGLIDQITEMQRHPPQPAMAPDVAYTKAISDMEARLHDMQTRSEQSQREFQHAMELERLNREKALSDAENSREKRDLMERAAMAATSTDSEGFKTLQLQMQQTNQMITTGFDELHRLADLFLKANRPMNQGTGQQVVYQPAPPPAAPAPQQYTYVNPPPAAPAPQQYQYNQYAPVQAAQRPLQQAAPAPVAPPPAGGDNFASMQRRRRAARASGHPAEVPINMPAQVPQPAVLPPQTPAAPGPVVLQGPSAEEIAALSGPPSSAKPGTFDPPLSGPTA